MRTFTTHRVAASHSCADNLCFTGNDNGSGTWPVHATRTFSQA